MRLSPSASNASWHLPPGQPDGQELKVTMLRQRLAAADAAAERAHEELLRACERAEAAEGDARLYQSAQAELQVCVASATGRGLL